MTAFVRMLVEDRIQAGVLTDSGTVVPVADTLGELWRLEIDRLRDIVDDAVSKPGHALDDVRLLPPIDGITPLWAAGVTYLTSRDARLEESRGRDVYELVYDAARPELFFKAQAHEVVTTADPIGRRSDSTNDTPEPELAVVVNQHGEVVAYGVANDMSSRSIEGENPLYLPQAKMFAACVALSPTLRVGWEVPSPDDLDIELTIRRNGETVFHGSTTTSRMKRSIPELVAYLRRAMVFPAGAILSTGTCLVPPLDETTLDGDEIEIGIDHVGSVVNTVQPTAQLLPWWSERLEDPTREYPR